ncbi:uncharacterized protein LOC122957886 [Acropora millepora]|uniref:uncharacterized protein LOC122957886 n=1 Tax=Acropora millepora TaxID=45264 RepID=UPI001CF4AD33|nr:uncharacterized protein LOC122957886 [Acropora millepora]
MLDLVVYSRSADSCKSAQLVTLNMGRFTSEGGRSEEVTSDIVTNFVEADRELREQVLAMDQEQIADNAASDGIRWNWNPPLGLQFGGVFESLVKVAKKTLKAVVGNAGMTDYELDIEALMNSRPLTYEGADPRDEPVLTPNHFSVGQLGGKLTSQVTDDIAFNPRNRWRLNLAKLFWKR